MINIAAMAKAGTMLSFEQKVNIREAMENAKIDREQGTCFQGYGFLHVDDVREIAKWVDELCEATPW